MPISRRTLASASWPIAISCDSLISENSRLPVAGLREQAATVTTTMAARGDVFIAHVLSNSGRCGLDPPAVPCNAGQRRRRHAGESRHPERAPRPQEQWVRLGVADVVDARGRAPPL